MSQRGINAMRSRLSGAGARVGQDVPVEPPYGVVTPGDIAAKAREVDAYVRALNTDIQTHGAALGEAYLASWHSFVTEWLADYDSLINHWYSWANRLTGTAMTRIQEMEAKARTFAVKYQQATGVRPNVIEPSYRPPVGAAMSDFMKPIVIGAAALGGLLLMVNLSK